MLRIMLNLDMSDLVNGGVISSDDTGAWQSFRADPYRWFIKAGDQEAAALFRLIGEREDRAAARAEARGTPLSELSGRNGGNAAFRAIADSWGYP